MARCAVWRTFKTATISFNDSFAFLSVSLSFSLSFFFLSFFLKGRLDDYHRQEKHSCKTDFILMTQFSSLFSLFSLFEFNFSLNVLNGFILLLTLWLSVFCAYDSFCQFRFLYLYTYLNPSISLDIFSLSFFFFFLS